ncbi:cupin domain-containing protein [Pseudonocardia xinjiangensis]|uniref:Cupin domain-containing protein n=1 Tax=Pseudonocardia xinjiangensis TaxID=75289 RepID=A0ABX1RIU2_9PSEU|nr:cupin domain-containing protein [Pseudonocardia xinjiangensis]NMH79354.1 cupin domain-containing protein [Pseudonocardia xinjiangensis]
MSISDAAPYQLATVLEAGAGSGQLQGREHGGTVSVILVSTDEPGAGPALHQHPYDETFVMHGGEAEFTVAGQVLVATAGQVVVVPPQTPHKFRNVGSERLVMTNIHANDVFITEWLE